MSRPPAAKPNQKMKPFLVADGCSIGDNNGVRRNGLRTTSKKMYPGATADTIMLTRDQAQYYMKKGLIQLELPEFEDDDEPSESDTAKAGSGPKVEGSGDADSGADAAQKSPQTKKHNL